MPVVYVRMIVVCVLKTGKITTMKESRSIEGWRKILTSLLTMSKRKREF